MLKDGRIVIASTYLRMRENGGLRAIRASPPFFHALYDRIVVRCEWRTLLSNPGVSPIDVGTPVGSFRVSVGDTSSVALVPAVTGMADYTFFSDAELQVILDTSSNSNSGMASAYRKLAAMLALKATTISTDDLKVATEQRAEIMRKIANDYQTASDSDLSNAAVFSIVYPFDPYPGEPDKQPWFWG